MTDDEVMDNYGAISSNGFSVHQQMVDAMSWLENNWPEDYAKIITEYPEYERLIWEGSWLDTEAMGVNEDWPNWLIDAIEATDHVRWIEGEPWG